VVQQLNAQGVTILLVEQNARAALRIAHRGYVLETGRVAMTATAATLLNDEGIRRAYLGY
jgi:branched-chain amino acid transport system ATP-binding protein